MTPGPLGVFLRGLAMGAADLVPGVSGGTIALITGIYGRLLEAITAVNRSALTLLLRGEYRGLWQHIDGTFLLALLLGIGAAIFGLAGVLRYLLETHPLPLWSFFCGLVLVSSGHLARAELSFTRVGTLLALCAGVLAMGVIGLAPVIGLAQLPAAFFLAGMLGICAMILPGISGSFILLILGMYEPVLAAVVARNVVALSVFALGCGVGLLLFSRILRWLVADYRQPMMAVLIGLLLGSLVILWPWQEVVQTLLDRHGELKPVRTLPVTPMAYARLYGDAALLPCLLSGLGGGFLVTALHRLANSPQAQQASERVT